MSEATGAANLGPYVLGPGDPPGAGSVGIYQGDARRLGALVPDQSVDLIFTDPPYLREYLDLYGWLAEFAERVLKPEGFLLAYAGEYYKDKVMQLLGKRLEYFWDFVSFGATGPGVMVWHRRIVSKHKSILAYRKAGSDGLPRCPVLGVWVGSGQDKRFHCWGQDESTARYYVDCFTKVGDVVVDPFCGGGTTPAVCKVLQRRWLAFDNDPQSIDVARQRVKEMAMPLFVPELDQVALMKIGET